MNVLDLVWVASLGISLIAMVIAIKRLSGLSHYFD